MDGAAGYPPWSAPHECRSPPTANLRSGRFVRAPARWVAAGVPWSEGSEEALMLQVYYPRPGFDDERSRTEARSPRRHFAPQFLKEIRCRLLLGDTVDCPLPIDNRGTIDSHDIVLGEQGA